MTQASTTETDSAPESTRRRILVERVLPVFRAIASGLCLLAVFAFAFLAMGAAYLQWGPPRSVPALTPKLRHLAQHRGEYDLLIFGSSRVFRGFVAPEFDRLMSEAGQRVRSFNVGVDGMAPPESFYTVRLALAQGERPKWMLVELWDLRTVAELRFTDIVRFVHWHDLRHTALVIDRAFHDDRLSLGEKLRRSGIHLYAALVRHAQRGQAAAVLQPVLNPPRPGKIYVEPTPWLATAGFSADTSKPFEGAKRAEFEAAVKSGKLAYRESALPPTLRRAAADLVRDVRAAGVEPVFIIMPTVNGGEGYSAVRSQGVDAALISMAGPQRYPDLYRTDWHRDDVHLTEVGARALTAHIVEEFRRIFYSASPAPNPQ
jgi:hypothetical protein